MANPDGIGGFRPGQSGNPGGRPKHPEITAAQALARKRLAMATARLAVIVRRGDAKDATAAARLLVQIAGVPLTPETPSAQPSQQPPAPSTMAPIDMKRELERIMEQ
jgi:hypothetical protein